MRLSGRHSVAGRQTLKALVQKQITAMSELLLVPIHVDALFVKDDTTKLIAPLADFSQIPYRCWVTQRRDHRKPPTTSSEEFNGDSPFTNEQIMRAPAILADLNLN